MFVWHVDFSTFKSNFISRVPVLSHSEKHHNTVLYRVPDMPFHLDFKFIDDMKESNL